MRVKHGLFGHGEEESKIEPAVRACQARGWDVQGPLPADTLFFRAGRGDFDIVVAMYHDQGHGPVKVLGIEDGVNITVGLPVIRTSVDHGTAFDIARTGKADERSLLSALAGGRTCAKVRKAMLNPSKLLPDVRDLDRFSEDLERHTDGRHNICMCR